MRVQRRGWPCAKLYGECDRSALVSSATPITYIPRIVGLHARFGQLQAVDVEGVKPAVHAREDGSVLRADEPATYPDRCAAAAFCGIET